MLSSTDRSDWCTAEPRHPGAHVGGGLKLIARSGENAFDQIQNFAFLERPARLADSGKDLIDECLIFREPANS